MSDWPSNIRRKGRRAMTWVAGMMLASMPLALGASFTASVEPSTVRLGESAQVTLVVENGQLEADPLLPAVPGLDLQYRGSSREVSFVNGQSSSKQILTFVALPRQVGDFTIPAVSARVDGRTVLSQPVKLKVVQANAALPNAPEQQKLAFLRLTASKTEVYLGEVLELELRLFFAVDLQDTPQIQSLAAEGFTLGKSVQLPRTQSQIGGVVYAATGVAMTATPTKLGTLQMGPVECSLTLKVPAPRRRRAADPFDDFWLGPMGGRFEARPVRLASEPLSIQVLPLPPDQRPPDFAGAVGEFAFNVVANPTNVAVGEPITLRIQISGRGAIENLVAPPLDNWREFKTYPPTSRTEATDTIGLQGAKTFEQVVVPQNTEIRELPGLVFSFFDPAHKAYRTLRQAPVPITVRPSGTVTPLAAISPARSGEANRPPSPQELVLLKTSLGVVQNVSAPLLYRPWFLALQGVPLLAWLSAALWVARREHLARNPGLVRRSAVSKAVRDGLRDLDRFVGAKDSAGFHALVFRLLQEQLGERLNLPAAAITEAVIEEQLQPRGVEAVLQRDLHELFQACNQARYAPPGSTRELRALKPKVERVLKALQEVEV